MIHLDRFRQILSYRRTGLIVGNDSSALPFMRSYQRKELKARRHGGGLWPAFLNKRFFISDEFF
jgi:hypothetical protein